jgi:hypothetical protein
VVCPITARLAPASRPTAAARAIERRRIPSLVPLLRIYK